MARKHNNHYPRKERIKVIFTYLIISVILLMYLFITPDVVSSSLNKASESLTKGFIDIFIGKNPANFLLQILIYIISAFVFCWVILASGKILFAKKTSIYNNERYFDLDLLTENIFLNKTNLSHYALLFTVIIAITLTFSGLTLLSLALPAESIFREEYYISSNNSTLECTSGTYQIDFANIIEGKAIICEYTRNKIFNNNNITESKIYPISNFSEEKELHLSEKDNKFSYNFKAPEQYQLSIQYNNTDKDFFKIHTQKTYSYEEYQQLQVERAKWFIGILSFSFFTVFAVANNIKNILSVRSKK